MGPRPFLWRFEHGPPIITCTGNLVDGSYDCQ